MVSVKKIRIETEVQLLTTKSGQLILLQEDIKLGDFKFNLQPVFECDSGNKILTSSVNGHTEIKGRYAINDIEFK